MRIKASSVWPLYFTMVLLACAHGGAHSASIEHMALRIPPSEQRPEMVARVSLVALRALSEADSYVRRDRTILNGRSLSIQQTVDSLAALPKPVKCRVAIESDVLKITAEPITDTKELTSWLEMSELDVDPNHENRRRAYGKGEDFMILVEDMNGGFPIDDATFNQWEREYDIPGISYAIVPQQDEAGIHPSAIVRFLPSSRATIQVRMEFEERQ